MISKVFLVGNPNAGKSLLFNVLTGHDVKVANFPGVTVDHKTGCLLNHPDIEITDLPGIYSFSHRSFDEKITTRMISESIAGCASSDSVIAIVDATQLKKGLYLVSELQETGMLNAVVLTMGDLISSSSLRDDVSALSQRIGVPVFLVSAASRAGIADFTKFLVQATQRSHSVCSLPRTSTGAQDALTNVEHHHHVVDAWLKGINLNASRSRQISRRIDKVALHPVFGPLVLVSMFLLLFEGLFIGSKPLVSLIDAVKVWSAVSVHSFFPKDSLLGSLIADGIIGGVGSVVAFVPLIAFLFLFLGALEDSGYMARAVFLLHRLMSRVGLSGRSFVPLVSGFSCSIPAILSTRIIESRPERLVTILITPLVSCSARLPIYALLIAAAFSNMPPLWGFIDVGAVVMVSMYVFGIVLAFGVAALLRKGLIKGKRAPLLMELPDYRWPRPRSLFVSVKSKVRMFVRDAGTVILAITIILWALFTFPLEQPSIVSPNSQSEVVETLPFAQISASHLEKSYAGQLGHLIEPFIEPLGFNWKIGVGLVASFAAREVFISTFGVIYGLSNAENSPSSLWQAMRTEVDPRTGVPIYTPLVAVSLLIFFAVALQCMSTVAVTRKETGTWRWPIFQLGYLNALAWVLSFTIFQAGTALGF